MRRLSALVCAAVLVVGVAGCGDDGSDPLQLVQAAGAATADEGTARVEMSMRGPQGDSTELSAIEIEGLVDMDDARGAMSMQLPVDLTGGREVEIEMAFDGTTVFMNFEPMLEQLGVDTEWVSFDMAELTKAAGGIDIAQLQGNNDPTQALAMLKGVADDVEEVGEEEVRGTDTTHYRATVDLEAALRESGGVTDPEQFERFLDLLGREQVPVDVWIDDEGRVRRQTYEQPIPGQSQSLTMTIELYDFGTDDEIELPDPDDVTDVTDLVTRRAEATAPA